MANERGWQPVFRRRHRSSNWRSGGGMHTVFIDNIPDSMYQKQLFHLFTNFGIVKDVFIPSKRRKSSGSRFGFVRYDCSVAAEMAIQKANRAWCDDKVLKVKKVEFGKEQDQHKDRVASHFQVPPRAFGARVSNVASTARRVSYVEALKGGIYPKAKAVVVKTEEYGNGWLYTSVMAKLWPKYSSGTLKEELLIIGLKDVQGEVVELDKNISDVVSLEWGKLRILTSKMESINNIVYLESRGCLYPVWVCEDVKPNYQTHGYSFSTQRPTESGKAIIIEGHNSKNYRGREKEEADVAGAKGDLAIHDGVVHSDKGVVCKVGGGVDKGNDYLSISVVRETCSIVGNRDGGSQCTRVEGSMQRNMIHSSDKGSKRDVGVVAPDGPLRSIGKIEPS
ncbi:hypothetical protein ACSBR1_023310 [Camellia fascicularis]